MQFFISPDFIAPKADVSSGSCAWLLAHNPCQKISQPVSASLRTPAFEASAKWWSTLEEIETSINLWAQNAIHRTARSFGARHLIASDESPPLAGHLLDDPVRTEHLAAPVLNYMAVPDMRLLNIRYFRKAT